MPAKMSNPKLPLRPQGIHWIDDLYLTSTSDIDGRRRWQEIVLLLASKLQTTGDVAPLTQLDSLLLDNLETKGK